MQSALRQGGAAVSARRGGAKIGRDATAARRRRNHARRGPRRRARGRRPLAPDASAHPSLTHPPAAGAGAGSAGARRALRRGAPPRRARAPAPRGRQQVWAQRRARPRPPGAPAWVAAACLELCRQLQPLRPPLTRPAPRRPRLCRLPARSSSSAAAPAAPPPAIMGVVEALFKWKPLFNMAAGKARRCVGGVGGRRWGRSPVGAASVAWAPGRRGPARDWGATRHALLSTPPTPRPAPRTPTPQPSPHTPPTPPA
jgi:hypothetical protein